MALHVVLHNNKFGYTRWSSSEYIFWTIPDIQIDEHMYFIDTVVPIYPHTFVTGNIINGEMTAMQNVDWTDLFKSKTLVFFKLKALNWLETDILLYTCIIVFLKNVTAIFAEEHPSAFLFVANKTPHAA